MPPALRMHSGAFLAALVAVCCADSAVAQDNAREAAQEALIAGEADRAVAILQDAIEETPEDADLLRRLASAHAAAGDLSAALSTIDRALELAPEDNDIRLARARILLWSERPAQARQQADQVALADPEYPGLAEVQTSIQSAQSSGQRRGIGLSAGISQIEFRNGARSTWERLSADGFVQFDKVTAAASVEHEKRALADTRGTIRFDRQTSFGSLYVGGSVTPSADFREEWSLSGGGVLSVADDATAHIDIRHSRYADNSVTSFQPGMSIAVLPSLTLAGRTIVLLQSEGTLKLGGSVRGDYLVSSGSSIFVGGAVYPDTEAGVTRRVSSVFGGATMPLTDTLALGVTGEYETRNQSYTRQVLTLGIRWRFGS